MDIAVIGTGFVGGILGNALARSDHTVRFGSRHPEDDTVADDTEATVVPIGDALDGADVVILAVPGPAVADVTAEYGDLLAGALVIDATNRMGPGAANSRAHLPGDVRYARAFNTLGAENMAEPDFADGPADLFFSGPEEDRVPVEEVVAGVGLRPVYLGPDQEDLVDCLFRVWIALAIGQGRGRRLAFRLLDH
jgi:8-hydroxy-5-deazaflavin:NADPH oxidoreductase